MKKTQKQKKEQKNEIVQMDDYEKSMIAYWKKIDQSLSPLKCTHNGEGFVLGTVSRKGSDHGYSGMVVIDANEGDVIAQGQKDNRGNNTDNSLYLVQEDGTLKSLSKVAAYDILSQKQ